MEQIKNTYAQFHWLLDASPVVRICTCKNKQERNLVFRIFTKKSYLCMMLENYMSVRTFFEELPPPYTLPNAFWVPFSPFRAHVLFQWPQSVFKIYVACAKYMLRYHISRELNRPFSIYLPTSADVILQICGGVPICGLCS